MEFTKITVTDEVKALTLVCLLLDKLGGLTEAQLLEIVTADGIVSQFALNDALTVIEKKGLANVKSDVFEITRAGKDWLDGFEGSLPATIKRKMLREGEDVVRLGRLKKAVKWSVVKGEDDWVFSARFLNETDGSPVMEIKIHSATRKGAVEIQERFLKNPAKIIKNTLSNFL